MSEYYVIGVMSGSSLDGLDIALCHFLNINNKWTFKILQARTLPYSDYWKKILKNAGQSGAYELIKIHKNYGSFIGKSIKKFLSNCKYDITLIASHGHTIFHCPQNNITFQLGDGAYIASETGIDTVTDFRNLDVALKGQGAPLVPIGDMLLFGNYDYYLNLGGFSNISFKKNDKIYAFDICPVNNIINHLVRPLNIHYDKDGKIAQKGNICPELLNKLNSIPYYNTPPPKSLDKQWIFTEFLPVINKYKINIHDLLRTIYEHITVQIKNVITGQNKTVLVTGGGAHNKFLVKRLIELTPARIIIPDSILIDFKEAIIFAFLGVLRYRNEINCLASVTGAKQNSYGGVIYKIKNN